MVDSARLDAGLPEQLEELTTSATDVEDRRAGGEDRD